MERVTGCYFCPWEIVTPPDGSAYGTESLVPQVHVLLCHPEQARARGKDPDALLAVVRESDVLTEAGWKAAREGGSLIPGEVGL